MVEKSTFSTNMLGAIWKSSGRVWGMIREIQEEKRRNSLIFWDVFRPRTAIFPDQNSTNPECFGNFLRWIKNAPEVKCRKIRPLAPLKVRRVDRTGVRMIPQDAWITLLGQFRDMPYPCRGYLRIWKGEM
jgi:hypothetical protein